MQIYSWFEGDEIRYRAEWSVSRGTTKLRAIETGTALLMSESLLEAKAQNRPKHEKPTLEPVEPLETAAKRGELPSLRRVVDLERRLTTLERCFDNNLTSLNCLEKHASEVKEELDCLGQRLTDLERSRDMAKEQGYRQGEKIVRISVHIRELKGQLDQNIPFVIDALDGYGKRLDKLEKLHLMPHGTATLVSGEGDKVDPVKRALKVLQDLEWSAPRYIEDSGQSCHVPACPLCEGCKPGSVPSEILGYAEGHDDECSLSDAIGDAERWS